MTPILRGLLPARSRERFRKTQNRKDATRKMIQTRTYKTHALVATLLLAGLQSGMKAAEIGAVTTIAGSPGVVAYKNGTGSQAYFESPKAMSTDRQGNIYTVDSWCGTLRKITPGGVVSTLAGPSPAMGCTAGSADGTGSAAQFNSP